MLLQYKCTVFQFFFSVFLELNIPTHSVAYDCDLYSMLYSEEIYIILFYY